jgi:hypothetical protein
MRTKCVCGHSKRHHVCSLDGSAFECATCSCKMFIPAPDPRDELIDQLATALDLCWQATGEAYAGDCAQDKMLAANAAARRTLRSVRAHKKALSSFVTIGQGENAEMARKDILDSIPDAT